MGIFAEHPSAVKLEQVFSLAYFNDKMGPSRNHCFDNTCLIIQDVDATLFFISSKMETSIFSGLV